MDRWIDADDDIAARARGQPQGRVARLGMAGFVKSQASIGTENAQKFGKIEVVQSKREQRKSEATRLMPPPKLPGSAPSPAGPTSEAPPPEPPRVQSLPAATGPPKCPVPEWAAEPPSGSRLLVYKDGTVFQEIALAKIVTVFGRVDALADVVLDHPSISRQHAIAAFHAGRGAWLITDLGSTHGTFIGDQQLAKNEPTELLPGTELRFAASTRRYKLPPAAPLTVGARSTTAEGLEAPAGKKAAGDMPPPPPPKRARVCFADNGAADEGSKSAPAPSNPTPDGMKPPAPGSRPRPLETVIGFSDGRDFTARVGPRVAATPTEGRFAAAVATTIVASPRPTIHTPTTPAANGNSALEGGSPRSGPAKVQGSSTLLLPRRLSSGGSSGSGDWEGEAKSTGGGEEGGGSDVKPKLRDFVDRIRKEPLRGPGNLYEQLPPPSR